MAESTSGGKRLRSNKEFSPYTLLGPDISVSVRISSLVNKGARNEEERVTWTENKKEQPSECEDDEDGERYEDGESCEPMAATPIDTLPLYKPSEGFTIPQVASNTKNKQHTPKQIHNQSRRAKWRVRRKSERIAKQSMADTKVKECAANRIRDTVDSSNNVNTTYMRSPREWTGPRIPPNTASYRLARILKMPGMRLIEWRNMRQTRLIKDVNEQRIGVLAGWPCDDWGEVLNRFHRKCKEVESRMKIPAKKKFNRRGPYPSLGMGISFGGGQEEPTELSNDEWNEKLLKEFREDPDVQRVARYHDYVLKAYFPELHTHYAHVLEKIVQDNPDLHPNFSHCCFAAATLNMGRAFTRRHLDHLNLYCGQCTAFPSGSFDYMKGGHLVLWDLKLVIEFPPGCTIVFPSALIEHSNIPIASHEERSSFVQYSAAGLFRWVNNGCMSDKTFTQVATPSQEQAWKEHRIALAKDGLKYFLSS